MQDIELKDANSYVGVRTCCMQETSLQLAGRPFRASGEPCEAQLQENHIFGAIHLRDFLVMVGQLKDLHTAPAMAYLYALARTV